MPAYPRLAQFAAPARPSAQIWRLLLGLAVIALLYAVALRGAIALLLGPNPGLAERALLVQMLSGSTPLGLCLTLLSFLPLLLATLFVTRSLHRRPVASLMGTASGRDILRQAVQVALPLLALAGVQMALSLLSPDVGKATPIATVIAWAPFALAFLAVQITAEEVLFRGYLLQQLAARFHSPLIWMVLPSLLFGALHYQPDEYGPNAIWVMAWAAGFGMLAADLTARSGSLGPALGLHFATNAGSLLCVGLYGNLDGLSLYTLVIDPRDPATFAPWLAVDAVAMLVSWLIARLILRR